MTSNMDDPELIAVRPDERLDVERLEPYLRAHLPQTDGAFAVGQFGGGHANLTYLIRFGETEYVLRRPPLGPIAPSAHDMKREHHVLAALYERFPLAPRSFLLCTDPAIIGAEFQVMERRNGIVIRRAMPGRFNDPVTCRRVGDMLVDRLAEFHAIKPADVGLGDWGKPDGFIARQCEGWIKRWNAAKDREYGYAEPFIAWLRANLPNAGDVTLVHNDYKLDNVLVASDDPARMVAMLDWDMCTRGDPLVDLGYLLDYWTQADDDPSWASAAAMPTSELGFPTRAEAAQRYARTTGRDLSELHWYVMLNLFRTIVILAQIYRRYLSGQTQDARFANFGERIAGLFEKARAMVPRGTI